MIKKARKSKNFRALFMSVIFIYLHRNYHKYVVSKAKSYGIPGVYWDNNCFTSKDGENFGLLDRKTCTFPERAKIALNGIMEGLK